MLDFAIAAQDVRIANVGKEMGLIINSPDSPEIRSKAVVFLLLLVMRGLFAESAKRLSVCVKRIQLICQLKLHFIVGVSC